MKLKKSIIVKNKKTINIKEDATDEINTRHNSFVYYLHPTAGITLIALVITIIVLLILAGISISLVVGENGILDQATTSVEANERAEDKEQISLAYAALQTDVLTGKKTSVTAADLEALINSTEGEGTVMVTENKSAGTLTIIYKESKIAYTINTNGEFINDKIEIVEPTNIGDWQYQVNEEENTVTIIGYNGSDTEIIVPNYIGGRPVKSILGSIIYEADMCPQGIWGGNICSSTTIKCGYVRYQQNTIEKVTISEGIEKIDEAAFAWGLAIKEIIIPNSVTSIGMDAFYNCTSLSKITIPSSVTSIGYGAFLGCESLNEITIPSSVTSVGSNAFFDCTSLNKITIPSSVTSISDYTFAFCESLSEITIPSSVTSIGEYAFRGCESLSEITIPNNVTSIGEYAFWECTNLSKVTISNSVTSIEKNAFCSCNSLQEVTIPSSVTSIGNNAFSNCSELITITIPNSVTEIKYRAFEGCSKLESVNYTGTEEEWDDIAIGGYNTELTSATINYNYGK